MEIAPEIELSPAPAETPILQWSGQRRFKYFLTGIIGPLGCLALALSVNLRPTQLWQSGELDTYMQLMLERPALLPFLPLLAYSMLAMGTCCIRPRLANKPWVRFGIYGGSILSTQYLIATVFVGSFFTFLAAAVVGPALALVTYVVVKLMPRARRITILQIMLLTAVVAVLAAGCAWLVPAMEVDGREIFFGGLFWVLMAVPLLNCMTYIRATFAILRSPALESLQVGKQPRLIAFGIAWLIAFGSSWKFTLDAILAEYAQLPPTQPNCYISSAAASGHPRFVGVAQFAASEKDADCPLKFPLNTQMCRLKFLELALIALSPWLHRLVRRMYNFVGPAAAAICKCSVWFADASYVALKPVEFVAWLIQLIARIRPERVRSLYARR